MQVAVLRETFPGERRVALVPSVVPLFVKAGVEVIVETGAGTAAGYSDKLFEEKGAKIAASRGDVAAADCLV